MVRILRYVQDLEGREYPLVTFLGWGGQGKVYAVEGGKLAVKLLQIPKSDSETRRNELHRKIASVRRLPLDNMPVARPLEMLREPHSGYVMELMTDMVPISHLLLPSHTMSNIDSPGHSDGLSVRQNPNYSPDVFADKPLFGWYVRTGSLRRRLKVLAHAADALSKLHAMGLVYGDVSRNSSFAQKLDEI